jgi:hypothetical protein
MSTQLVQSSADGLIGFLEVGNTQTSFGPVGEVSGSAPPSFQVTNTVAAFDNTYSLDPSDLLHPTLHTMPPIS